jgi:hypothetical protein
LLNLPDSDAVAHPAAQAAPDLLPNLLLTPDAEAISLAPLMRALPAAEKLNILGAADALRRYRAAYRRVKPALEAPGGIAATLRLAPELAANMDQWMLDEGAALIIPVRAARPRTMPSPR